MEGGGLAEGMKESISTTFGTHWFSNFSALSVFFTVVATVRERGWSGGEKEREREREIL